MATTLNVTAIISYVIANKALVPKCGNPKRTRFLRLDNKALNGNNGERRQAVLYCQNMKNLNKI